jgi:hypothetical protein
MAKQRGEPYCAMELYTDSFPHCVVAGCTAPIAAEVHIDSYADALDTFRGIRRKKVCSRQPGDERFFVCQEHLDHDQRMAALEWQLLMF